MSKLRSFGGVGAALALSLAAAVTPAWAQQQRTLFTWNGRVDREVLIVMRGRDVSTRASNAERGRERARIEGVLPRAEGVVTVNVNGGRGDVDVVQQPNSRNDYTTIVRIRDERSGDDRYRVAAYWRPTSYGDARGNDRDGRYDDRDDRRGRGRGQGGWGRGRDRNDDDRRDRGDRGDRDDRRGNGNGGWGNGNGDGGWGNGNGYSGALAWRGQVDDVVEVRVQGRRVDYVTRSGATVRDVQTRVSGSGLPERDVNVSIRNSQGRGSVRVAQQPSARNGYTAIIRIDDPQGGFGYYDFQAAW
jgi:hypothetical protein